MKVGDYVRTKIYGIKKINGFSYTLEEDFIDCDYDKYQRVLINKKEIIKSSPKIIDLIEVGDYVNGIYIDTIEKEQKRVWHTSCYGDDDIIFYNNDIKSIVTKEQFESMQYEVDK